MMLRHLSLAAVLAVAPAACTDFDSIPRGICGNGLVEAGEDCDAGDARCVRCAITCAAAADCPNEDYTCGVDGFCHAPGGALAAPSAPVTFQVDDLRVTDVDHDGTGDVLGVSKTSAVVRYGDSAGSLSASESFLTPAQSGPPSFGDVDGDGSLDLSLETLDGIVSFTSRYGSLAPAAIESPIYGMGGEELDFATLFVVGPQQLAAFLVVGGNVVLAVIDLLQPNMPFAVSPCMARLGPMPRQRLVLSSVDLYQASPPGALTTQLVIAFATAAGEPCVTAINGSSGNPWVLTDITPANATPLQKHPKLVDTDADGDPCPALINSDNGAQLRRWEGQMSGGRCTLTQVVSATGNPMPSPAGGSPSAAVIGRVPVVPPFPGTATDALVMTSGVYVIGSNALGEVYASSRPLGRVAHADLDNDGDVDMIVSPANEDDLDILYRYPGGVEVLRVDTASRVTSITTADYDGNTFADIAYTETAIGHQRMMIAYGTSDRPLPPVQVATFSDVAAVTVLQVPDSVDRLNIADDLIVIQPGTGGTSTASFLHGSPQRTMLSFFDPRPETFGVPSVLRAAVVGRFVGAADSPPDLFALATQPPMMPGVRAWTIAGKERGLDNTPNPGSLATGLGDCDGAGDGVLCIHNAMYLAWPIAPDRDVVLAVERPQAALPKARVIDPRVSPPQAKEAPALVDALPAGVVPRALHAADVRGDGAPELIAAFATRPGAGAPTGIVRVCDVDAAGVPESCEELTPIVQALAPTVVACIDAAPGRMSPRDRTTAHTAAVDLVVLCRGAETATSLFRLTHDGSWRASPLAQGVNLRAIRVDDINGDGVDDVVALQGDSGSQTLLSYRQCTSREAASCRLPTAEAAGGAP